MLFPILDVPVTSKAPKSSSQTEEVPQGKKPGAKSGLRRKESSKHTSESKTEASKSKTGRSEKETQSSLAKDKSLSHPSPPTQVVGEMHKEAQQAAGGPTSLRATSEEGAHPQLNSDHDALADSTVEADPGLSTPNDSIPTQHDQTKSTGDGLTTAHTDSDTNEESEADDNSKKIKLKDLSDLLKDTRSSFFTFDSPQDEPIIVSDESEEEVAKDNDTHASSHDVPKDTSIPHPPSEKLNTLDSLPSLLNKVTDNLNRFVTVVDNTLGDTTKGVPLTGQATASPAEGEKNTNPATTNVELNLHDEFVDLLGIDVVTLYYNKKLLYDKYCDKMIQRRKSSKITNCEVLTQKGPI
nr:hypothetical protein [Tanacetum cinerariifolium]